METRNGNEKAGEANDDVGILDTGSLIDDPRRPPGGAATLYTGPV